MKKKIIYHGTFRKIKGQLSAKNLTEDNAIRAYYGEAVYFSDNYDVAAAYAEIEDRIQPDFYKRQIFSLEIDKTNFVVVYGKERGIHHQEEKIKKHLKNGKNVKVVNVRDSNLTGAQCKRMPFNPQDDYKYVIEYYVDHKIKRKTKKVKEMIEQAKQIGVRLNIINNTTYNYLYMSSREVTLREAKKLDKLGIKIEIAVGRNPNTATTYIIQDSEILKEAKILDFDHMLDQSKTPI